MNIRSRAIAILSCRLSLSVRFPALFFALFLVLFFACAPRVDASELVEIGYFPADNIRAGKVELRVWLLQREQYADLIIDFVPVGPEKYHLYSSDLPRKGIDGVGRPTLVEAVVGTGNQYGAAYRATGKVKIDKDIIDLQAVLPIYSDGPVRAVLPIHLPFGDGSQVESKVSVTYMSCTDTRCNRPVNNRLLSILLPSHEQGYVFTDVFTDVPGDVVDDKKVTIVPVIHKHSDIQWIYAESSKQLEDMIEKAAENNISVMLNFTGPSCSICQTMKKTVFLDKRVIAGWNAYQAIEINTDDSEDLALWEQEKYLTQARPLYVRIDPNGTFEMWSQTFSVTDEETMGLFLAFLNGGTGLALGTGEGWWQFLLLAIGGGLFTLLMPCTYPMIPLTVNFFNKQVVDGKGIVPLALAYSLGIVLFFTLIGVFIVFTLQSAISTFAGNPWTNLVIALLFLVMGLSLLDVFFLRLPHSVSRYFGSGAGGYLGALVMGCTFAVTAFTCTAPFAGAVLAEGLNAGSVIRPIVGMAVYASAIAIPFFVLSLSPKLLKNIPNAGSWMSEIKHVGGIVEIAAAMKFLVICDYAWSWGIFGRSMTLSLWTLGALLISMYIAGYIRLAGDREINQVHAWRVVIAILWLIVAFWFLIGLLGLQNLGVIESFFPNDEVPI